MTVKFSVAAACTIALALLTAAACAAAAQSHGSKESQAGTDVTEEIQFDGRTRTFIVHFPEGYNDEEPVPLVLSFHGRHGQGRNQAELSGFDQVADRHGFIVVYPDGVGKSWNALHGTGEAEELGVDDVGFVGALIDTLMERYKIDPRRIYASGMSNGGVFAHRLGCEMSERFAAIASVAGQMAAKMAEQCDPADAVAVIDFHGTRDRIVPYDGGETKGGGDLLSAPATAEAWRKFNGCDKASKQTFSKGDVSCITYTGGRAPVTLCTVKGTGHTWPGGYQYMPRLLVGKTSRDVNASEMIWDFFAANPKLISPRRAPGRTAPEKMKD